MKRDPGSLARKQRFREHACLRYVAARRGKRCDANAGRKRETEKERRREGEKIRGAKPDGTRSVYLDDSPACFARRPYETG